MNNNNNQENLSSKKIKSKGSKEEVFNGEALQTAGGLRKGDLIQNKKGKIVSKKKSEYGNKAVENLKKFKAAQAAEHELHESNEEEEEDDADHEENNILQSPEKENIIISPFVEEEKQSGLDIVGPPGPIENVNIPIREPYNQSENQEKQAEPQQASSILQAKAKATPAKRNRARV